MTENTTTQQDTGVPAPEEAAATGAPANPVNASKPGLIVW